MWWMKHEKHGEGPVDLIEEVKLREAAGWVVVDTPPGYGNMPVKAEPAPKLADLAKDAGIAETIREADDSIFGGGDDDDEQDTDPAPPAGLTPRKPGRPPKSAKR